MPFRELASIVVNATSLAAWMSTTQKGFVLESVSVVKLRTKKEFILEVVAKETNYGER